MKKTRLIFVASFGILFLLFRGACSTEETPEYFLKKGNIKQAYKMYQEVKESDTSYTSAQQKLKELQPKHDSILNIEATKMAQEIRTKELNTALYVLETNIKSTMKDPDSYDLIKKMWNPEDKGEKVNMFVKFRGNNSFGGKTVTTVEAVYNMTSETFKIVKQY